MRRLLFGAMVALMAVACINIEEVVEPTLQVELNSLSVSYEAQEVEISVVSNNTVEVEVDANWLTLDEISSGETQVVVLLVGQNKSEQPREATIIIKAGELEHRVTLEQEGKPAMMDLFVGHSGSMLESPLWGGENVCGDVDWGDGTSEEYSEGMSHDYSDDTSRTATFRMVGADSFTIESIGQIENIDIVLH